MNAIENKQCETHPSVSRKGSSLTAPNSKEKRRLERPHETWYYSSNHVMINRERMMRGIAPLMRSIAFDEVARKIAIAAGNRVRSSEIHTNQLFRQLKCDGTILQGPSIRCIHNKIMKTASKGKQRILKEAYQQFGIGTYKNSEGILFVVQIFSHIGRLEF